MPVAGGVAVRDRLFDELERLDAEGARIRKRMGEVRASLKLLAELGAIDLDSEDGNGRRPNSEADSEAPEPRAAPAPPPLEVDWDALQEAATGSDRTRAAEAGDAGPRPGEASVPSTAAAGDEKPAPKEGPCPACGEVMAVHFLASHISRVHKLPKAVEFNAERFDDLVEYAGWSNAEVGRRLQELAGVAPGETTIENWRKGRSQPGRPFVEALAELLGGTTGELVWRRK